eukprot:CAMPEP_0197623768 /NCGR_PEP_ID=MMETSP1338-20131121/3709_1 /TAXON_ID=43686 ORGANISM="Pelagodinium beii, Strain RCC1491" /NCGR_SAMPLE_ID=MMETSP1338 /ASSEMBLY_ACC=CAM_ASM_000754 /LENGTH=105 /DNA_ID=CAMNT_0043193841 /DNA_START=43 /DNA_END=357 /DNA_ORIENTATION=+
MAKLFVLFSVACTVSGDECNEYAKAPALLQSQAKKQHVRLIPVEPPAVLANLKARLATGNVSSNSSAASNVSSNSSSSSSAAPVTPLESINVSSNVSGNSSSAPV